MTFEEWWNEVKHLLIEGNWSNHDISVTKNLCQTAWTEGVLSQTRGFEEIDSEQ